MSFLDKFLNRSEKQQALDAWPTPSMPSGFEDWTYGDLPVMALDEFEEFCKVVGDGNLHWLTMVGGNMPGIGDFCRGQYFMSPKGKMNLDEYIAKNKH